MPGRFYGLAFLPLPLKGNIKYITSLMDFQTPPIVADYMAEKLPMFLNMPTCLEEFRPTCLEPTPGKGNLVAAVNKKHPYHLVTAPENFHDLSADSRFYCAIMNPPFTPMALGYTYLQSVMQMTDHIVALLPWFILINSEKRMKAIMEFGLSGVTHLPRKTFPNCRIQCCVIVLNKAYKGSRPYFDHFTW